MNKEEIETNYIEMLIRDLEEHSLEYWDSTQDEMVAALRKLQQENKCLKEEYVMLQNASDEVEDGLRENYNKTLSMLVETELLPCDCFEDYFNCCECNYCNKECSNGDKNCWKNFIENYYKNKQ